MTNRYDIHAPEGGHALATRQWSPWETQPEAVETRHGVRVDASRPERPRRRLLETSDAERKTYPLATGLLDYFPDALAEVAKLSYLGNQKHNPGEPMHHARGKSMDHADCIARHLTERGGFDVIEVGGVEYRQRHSASLAWRALALLQEELEREYGFPLPRGARGPDQK